MTKIKMVVDCANCGEEITHLLGNVDGETQVHIACFQDSWECMECGHTTVLADLEGIDEEGL